MTKSYVNKNGRIVKATQWNKDGDHPKVIPYARRPEQGSLLLNGGVQIAITAGSYLVEVPYINTPVVWRKETFERNHKEIKE